MWLTDWEYRRKHIVNPAFGAGQNYQKRIIVHYDSGINTDENVYLNEKCKTDFGDVRFTDNTGFTLLSYWIEKKVDNNYAIFWIKIIEDLGVYDRKIYIYYGNAGATSVANGDTTFIFFDDFEVDLSKWTLFHAPTLSTDHAYFGIKSVKLPPIVNSFIQHLEVPSDKAVHAHFYDEMSLSIEQTYITIDAGEAETSWIGVMNDIAQYEYNLQGVNYNSGIDRTVGWHEFIIRCTTNLKQFIIDGNIMPITGIGNYSTPTLIGNSSNSVVATYWDSIFIRKFINPEPVHGMWGSEENEAGIIPFEVEDIIKLNNNTSLTLEEIICSLVQKPINMEETLVSLIGSLHLPLLSEDIMNALSRIRIIIANDILFSLLLSVHLPISSEDIINTLSAKRAYAVIKEFITLEKMFPIIGGGHIINIKE